MKKYKAFTLFLCIALLVPALFGVGKVFAANPSFTIGEVVTDKTVTILIKDAPKNREFIVRMGEYDTKAINGIEAGRFQTGEGGNLQATIDIPAAFAGRAQIAIRMDSVTGGWYYYNWFWNKKEGGTWPPPSTTPEPTPSSPVTTPQPTKTPPKIVPTITIISAVESQSVTIAITNFPKNAEMRAFMGEMYTKGKDGIPVGDFTTTDAAGTEVTLNIPGALANDERVAIRVESVRGGWYSYNWFWNKQGGRVVTPPSSGTVTPAPTQPGDTSKYPALSIISVDSGKTVTIKADNLPQNTEFTVLLGKMWTRGLNGIPSATFNSGPQTSAELTVDIPASLANESLISIRIQGTNGRYAYNWFINK